MKKPDKNKVYDLSELTSEEWDLLTDTMKKESNRKFKYDSLEANFKDGFKTISFSLDSNWVLIHNYDVKEETTNAKELFYTLENIQVDCRELSEEQIKEMADVFEKAGYETAGFCTSESVRFLLLEDDICFIASIRDKHTITHEKFMELFGSKQEKGVENCNNLGYKDLWDTVYKHFLNLGEPYPEVWADEAVIKKRKFFEYES